AFVLMIVGVAVPFGMIAYHNRPGYPVILVIPNGYRGPVKLVVDRREGVDIPATEGAYRFIVPPGGTLPIKDAGPFHQWHTLTAVFANGGRIPHQYESNRHPEAATLYSLGSSTSTHSGTSI